MNKEQLIVVTGAAGFIASYLVGHLNRMGYTRLVLVDDFSRPQKEANYQSKQYETLVNRAEFATWLDMHHNEVGAIFHLGARTDTTEMDYSIHEVLNVEYSKKVWQQCSDYSIPLVYASSAATYGGGEYGYSDAHEMSEKLVPLNPYGVSKNEFDKWALQQTSAPPFWAGLKFFNVYGPNEYHKGRMASVIFHAYNQIKDKGTVKLFRSHNPNYKDGEQIRDFIYVKDVASICTWLMANKPKSGIYNTGTGNARTFKALVTAIFTTLHLEPNIEYVDTPLDIRDKYQYFTEADMTKLIEAGYNLPFHSLEEGINDYVSNFLSSHTYF